MSSDVAIFTRTAWLLAFTGDVTRLAVTDELE